MVTNEPNRRNGRTLSPTLPITNRIHLNRLTPRNNDQHLRPSRSRNVRCSLQIDPSNETQIQSSHPKTFTNDSHEPRSPPTNPPIKKLNKFLTIHPRQTIPS